MFWGWEPHLLLEIILISIQTFGKNEQMMPGIPAHQKSVDPQLLLLGRHHIQGNISHIVDFK